MFFSLQATERSALPLCPSKELIHALRVADADVRAIELRHIGREHTCRNPTFTKVKVKVCKLDAFREGNKYAIPDCQLYDLLCPNHIHSRRKQHTCKNDAARTSFHRHSGCIKMMRDDALTAYLLPAHRHWNWNRCR